MLRQGDAFVLRKVENLNLLVACKCNKLNEWIISLNDMAVLILKEAEGKNKEELLQFLTEKLEVSINGDETKEIEQFIDQLIKFEILVGE